MFGVITYYVAVIVFRFILLEKIRRTMALWLRQLSTGVLDFIRQKRTGLKTKAGYQRRDAARQSALLPEAHASNAFQPATAKP